MMNVSALPGIIGLILSKAFTVEAFTGAAVFWGVKRGIFSNEAGQGTGPHAASASEVQHPAQQGLVQAFSVYIDTLFVCTATAFMILITRSYNVLGENGVPLPGFHNVDAAIDPNTPTFTQLAVETALPGVGKPFVAIALFFFAFTTLLAYYYIAETNVAYLRRFFTFPGELTVLKLFLMASVFYGAIRTASLAWGLGEIGVGIMAWLNIVAILILYFMGRPAIKALRDYERQRKAGVREYTFDPDALGIRNADFWKRDRGQAGGK
jgi:AGCS family alanine or glycine:cation symporter